MNIGCFSGGGSYGAYTIGVCKRKNPIYDITIGCSTGSLIAPLAVLGEWSRLAEAYTNVTQKSIFNVNPFKKNGNVKIFKSLFRLLIGKQSIGENYNLLDLIPVIFTKKDYERIIELKKEVIITVCNINSTFNQTEYIYLSKTPYKEFVKYMWASTCVPIICNSYKVNNAEYVDGGTTEVAPLNKALEYNPTNIDLYLHSIKPKIGIKKFTTNIFQKIIRIGKIQRDEIRLNDILEALTTHKNIINISYLPYEFSENSLTFDKEIMKKRLELGYLI